MPFTLPPLPWEKNALAPHISQETVEFHYGKHHATYVTKLNMMTEGKPEADKSLEEIIQTSSGPMFNQAAQIYNHTFYWNSLSPNGGGNPTGAVANKIAEAFSSFDDFKKQFSDVAAGHFGSGWAWLCVDPTGRVYIECTHDAGCPIRDGKKPLLTCDVWEHAYYIDYRNARPEYIKAWWNLVNWDFANENLRKLGFA